MLSLLTRLQEREIGRKRNFTRKRDEYIHGSVEKRLDRDSNNICSYVRKLKIAISKVDMDDINEAVTSLFSKIIDTSGREHAYLVLPKKRQERELFVESGGVYLMLKLFENPFLSVSLDSKKLSTTSAACLNQYSTLYNEVLVILREVSFSIPTFSEQIFGNQIIIFLFTLLSYRSVFENSVSLLEEILAVRTETFNLADVPNLYELISNFNSRKLAHFCRVLSLVLFEPEDRQIMEGSQVLRSIQLLQLRRDRMAKFSNVVEKNQCLVSFTVMQYIIHLNSLT